jgi:hypothetical protein
VEQRYRFFSYGDAMLIDGMGLIDRTGRIDRTGSTERAGTSERTGPAAPSQAR